MEMDARWVRKWHWFNPTNLPWKRYFDLISLVDEFVLFDDTQYLFIRN
jgi:WbqC-like protein